VYHRDNYEQGVAKIMARDQTRQFEPWSPQQMERYTDVLQLRSDADWLLQRVKALQEGRSPLGPKPPVVLQSRM